jgi:predicted DNA binding protein
VRARIVVLRRLDEEALAALLQDLAQAQGWGGAELLGVRDAAVEAAALAPVKAEPLTGRQEEVLRIAHALGYYRTPRGCTLEDIAATLGVSANAVHKNLTAAEQRIIHGHVAGMA